MVLISHKYKFIYIKTKKTGSTTTENFFTRFCIDNENNYKDSHSHDYLETKNGIVGQRILGKGNKLTVNTELKDLNLKKYKDYYIFTTVRNPFDRMVSLYNFFKNLDIKRIASPTYFILQKIIKSNKNLNDIQLFRIFIKKSINKIYDNWNAYTLNNTPSCNYYIKQENLENGIEKVCKKLNIDYNKYKLVSFKRQYRKTKTYREFYDEETFNLVKNKFIKEIKFFNYKFK